MIFYKTDSKVNNVIKILLEMKSIAKKYMNLYVTFNNNLFYKLKAIKVKSKSVIYNLPNV